MARAHRAAATHTARAVARSNAPHHSSATTIALRPRRTARSARAIARASARRCRSPSDNSPGGRTSNAASASPARDRHAAAAASDPGTDSTTLGARTARGLTSTTIHPIAPARRPAARSSVLLPDPLGPWMSPTRHARRTNPAPGRGPRRAPAPRRSTASPNADATTSVRRPHRGLTPTIFIDHPPKQTSDQAAPRPA